MLLSVQNLRTLILIVKAYWTVTSSLIPNSAAFSSSFGTEIRFGASLLAALAWRTIERQQTMAHLQHSLRRITFHQVKVIVAPPILPSNSHLF